MERIKYRISLDMFEVSAQTTIKAKKGDTACSIYITLTENGKIYNITDGCYAVFSAKKPDGNYIFNSDTCSIEDNAIVYDFTEQTAPCEGVVECEVILFKDGQKLTSPCFNLVVDGTVYNGEEIVSSTSIDVFAQMVEETSENKFAAAESAEAARISAETADDAANTAEKAAELAVNAREGIEQEIANSLTEAKQSGEFDGKDGKDGIPATHRWNGTVLTVTSASGTSSADLKGDKGDSGVYVGAGDMPTECNIQIDPDGEPITEDYIANLIKTQVEKALENKMSSPLTGKKIIYDGDSICSSWGISINGGAYPQIIADTVGGTFDNQGVGGGRIVTQEGSSDTFHSIVDNLVNLPIDGDLYCFEGGVNDHWHGVPLGTFSESDYTGTLDKTTYCGALETIFRYATTKFVGKPICYIITHKCPTSAFTSGYYGSTDTFADFRKAALGICEKYSIPVYDAWKDSGINSWNASQLDNFFIIDDDTGTGDGTHPNEAGYRRYYVPQLIDLFERIMPISVADVDVPDEPVEPTYTNVLDTVGYTKGVYLSNGAEKSDENACTSGYIPITTIPSTIYLKNVTMPDESSRGNRVGYYDADKSFVAQMSITSSYSDARPVFYADGNLKQFYVDVNNVAYLRINGWNIDDTSIITVNEPIVKE